MFFSRHQNHHQQKMFKIMQFLSQKLYKIIFINRKNCPSICVHAGRAINPIVSFITIDPTADLHIFYAICLQSGIITEQKPIHKIYVFCYNNKTKIHLKLPQNLGLKAPRFLPP